MQSKLKVLVIPGLGGNATVKRLGSFLGFLNQIQRKREYLLFDPLWHSPESYQTKLSRLKKFYAESNKPTKIFAFSAGVSLAVILVDKNLEINKVRFVCGKALGPEKIGDFYLKTAPSILESVRNSEKVNSHGIKDANRRIVCYVPIWRTNDGTVEVVDMKINGSKLKYLPPLSHIWAIIFALVFYLPSI